MLWAERLKSMFVDLLRQRQRIDLATFCHQQVRHHFHEVNCPCGIDTSGSDQLV